MPLAGATASRMQKARLVIHHGSIMAGHSSIPKVGFLEAGMPTTCRAREAQCSVPITDAFIYNDLIPSGLRLEDTVWSVEGEDKRLFLEFARKMLQWLPEDRKTAKELSKDPWLFHLTG